MAPADWTWMAAVAGEELAKLEASHPGRLGPLKAELRHLIAEPGWDGGAGDGELPLLSPDGGVPTWSSSSSAQPAAPADLTLTQESTNRKRKRDVEEGMRRRRRRRRSAAPAAKDSADMAIERARKCLERIRALKQSLLG